MQLASWPVNDPGTAQRSRARQAPAAGEPRSHQQNCASASAACGAAQALVGAARGEPSGAVRRAYAAAAAALARQAPEARVAKLVAEAVGLYAEPGACCAAAL